MPPTFTSVQAMAALLASQHGQPIQPGKNWVKNFIDRNNTLKSKYNCKYNYKRAECKDVGLIQTWFESVLHVKTKYGIIDGDTYNFDKTGFQMGIISTAKVVTQADHNGRSKTTQPGNQEWVTAVEAVCADVTELIERMMSHVWN
jgi:hypothetical protein